MKYLFENFLHDKRVYSLNEVYYKRLLESVIGQKAVPFFTRTFANGKKMYDDHIFSAKANGRLVQIIQQEPRHEKPYLNAITKKWEDKTDMLIVTLELSEEVKEKLIQLLYAWLVEQVSPEGLKSKFANTDQLTEYQIRFQTSQIQQVAEPTIGYSKTKKSE